MEAMPRLVQRLVDAGLVGAERAAALQHEGEAGEAVRAGGTRRRHGDVHGRGCSGGLAGLLLRRRIERVKRPTN